MAKDVSAAPRLQHYRRLRQRETTGRQWGTQYDPVVELQCRDVDARTDRAAASGPEAARHFLVDDGHRAGLAELESVKKSGVGFTTY
jgi:hypothetical protein